MLDKAKIITTVYEFFSRPEAQLSQGHRPDGTKGCYYRFDPETGTSYAEAPLRCGIGCGFPDNLWDESMEGLGVYIVLRNSPPLLAHFGVEMDGLLPSTRPSEEVRFLEDVQDIHDSAENVEVLLSDLRRFAASHDVTLN